MRIKENLLEKLNILPYFNKNFIYQLGKQMGLKDKIIDTYISRFLKYRDIIKLKNGLYVSTNFFDKNKQDITYLFYLSNIIETLSYVSSWAALQYYNLITDVVYPITSVTSKITRKYQNKIGNFTYQFIKKDLFSDFVLVGGKFNFYIASPSKALFDLLYFRTREFRGIKNIDQINNMIYELRIDINEMDKKEQKKFYLMINKNI